MRNYQGFIFIWIKIYRKIFNVPLIFGKMWIRNFLRKAWLDDWSYENYEFWDPWVHLKSKLPTSFPKKFSFLETFNLLYIIKWLREALHKKLRQRWMTGSCIRLGIQLSANLAVVISETAVRRCSPK